MSRTYYIVNTHRLRKASLILLGVCTIYVFCTRIVAALNYTFKPCPHPALIIDSPAALRYENITTNLITASTSKESTKWASNLPIPHLKVLRYISDSISAEYHPTPLNKGREALMYFTYLHDFYDKPPDVSIFIHPDETPCHVEGTLLRNTSFALSHLNPQEVVSDRGGYFSLRVTWRAGCPNWINTTKTFEDDWKKSEEP